MAALCIKNKPKVLHYVMVETDCPGLSWDRVNFHKKWGGDTAGLADQTWPKNPEYSTPCALRLGSEWGSWLGGTSLQLRSALGIRW